MQSNSCVYIIHINACGKANKFALCDYGVMFNFGFAKMFSTATFETYFYHKDIQIDGTYYLPPAAEGRGREIIKRLPYVCMSVCACIHLSCFCINLNISFIYKDIFTKFAGNVYGYENLSVQNFEKQNCRHS